MAPAAAPPREMHQFPPGVCSFPVFGVCWTPLEPLPEGGGSHEGQGNWGVHPSPEAGVVVAGGGGNLKSGVNNRIAFYSLKADSTGASVPVLRHETDTHPRVCSAVAVDDKGHLLGACFGKMVLIYAVARRGLAALEEFQADEHPKDPSVGALCFTRTKRGQLLLATGGEDGIVRIWKLDISPDDLDQACSTVAEKDPTEKGGGSADTLTDEEKRAKAKAERNKPATLPLPSLEDKHLVDVTLMSKCAGHGKPVSCIRWHPNKALLVSASKDGTARVWSASDGKEVAVLPTASGLPPAVADAGASRITCRSCAISPAGDAIYTVQSGPRGKAYVTWWSSIRGAGLETDGMRFEPVSVTAVSESPVTHISLREDGTCMAIGNADGRIGIFSLPNFRRLKAYAAHDLPVTGLSFVPGEFSCGVHDLLACSADYRITLISSTAPVRQSLMAVCLAAVYNAIVSLLRAVYFSLLLSGVVLLLVLFYAFLLPPSASHSSSLALH